MSPIDVPRFFVDVPCAREMTRLFPFADDENYSDGLYAVGELTDGNYGIGTMAMGMLLGRKLAEA